MTLGICDMAGELGLSRATAHRYAATLHELGWLEQTRARKYRLAHRSAWPGITALGQIAFATDCEPVLGDLRAQTGHTASLGVLHGRRVTYVRRLSAHGRGQYEADGGLRAGAHVPLHCTALGHALLAGMVEEELNEVLRDLELVRYTSHSITGMRRLRDVVKQARDAGGVAVSAGGFVGAERSIAAVVPKHIGGWRLAVELNAPAASVSGERLLRIAGRLVSDAAAQIARSLKANQALVCPQSAGK